MDLKARREAFGAEDLSWLGSAHGTEDQETVTLDGSLFGSDNFTDGEILSGTVLGKVAATGLYGPYSGSSDEVQTATITGSPTGGSFTLTYAGQTTGAIAYNATAAAVQTALRALSNIGEGDVSVTGSAGGPYTITFAGALADSNVAQITATASLTGGSTPGVTMATTTAGGADTGSNGLEVAVGFLATTTRLNRPDLGDATGVFVNAGAALLWHGRIVEDNLPVQAGAGHLDANAKADLAAKFRFV